MAAARKRWRWRRLGIGLAILLTLGFLVRTWVVPALITRALQARYGGRLEFRDWWVNLASAGVTDLRLHEGESARSEVWLRADRVATDISLASLARLRVAPGEVKFQKARIAFRFDRAGLLLTMPPFRRPSGPSTALPKVAFENVQLILSQEGRPALNVVNLDATAVPEADVFRLNATANDPNWGRWNGTGDINPSVLAGKVTLGGLIPSADPQKEACIPFISPLVWDHVVPRGPVEIRLNLRLDPTATTLVHVDTLVGFRHTDVMLPALGLHATDAVGDLTVNDGIVLLKGVRGQMLSGRVAMDGPLDFSRSPTRIELALGLDGIEVSEIPKAWGVGLLEASGRLTGKVPLRVEIGSGPLDFSRTTGTADMARATLRGIPVENVHLDVPADEAELPGPAPAEAPAAQVQAPPGPAEKKPDAPAPGVRLPALVVAELGVSGLALQQVHDSLAGMGVHLPAVEGGRIWADGRARIPLGRLADADRYDIRGQARLVQFTVEGTDFALLETPFELVHGVLVLPRFDGRLADRPAGFVPAERIAGGGKRPASQPGLATGSAGVFRGSMRAEVAPKGKLEVKVVGERLQLGEVLAPVLPRPTPVTGEATIEAEAEGRFDNLTDTNAWHAHGQVRNGTMVAQGIAFEKISTGFTLANGRLELPDIDARLAGQPMRAGMHVELAAPFPFQGRFKAEGWNISDVVRLTKGAQHAEHVKGLLSATGEARGTMSPGVVEGDGDGRLDSFQTASIAFGAVTFRWVLKNNALQFSPVEARPFGGSLAGNAYVPITGNQAMEGSAVLKGIEAAKLADALGAKGLELTGKGSGEVKFTLPPEAEKELAIKAHLTLPTMSIRGVPYKDVVADLHTDKGIALYEVNAQSLGGKVLVKGKVPLFESDADALHASAEAELDATGFRLAQVWDLVNVHGPLHNLDGQGEIHAKLVTPMTGFAPWVQGRVELEGLNWNERFFLGALRGDVAASPAAWRLESVRGDLFGGPAEGSIWIDSPTQKARHMGFDFKVDRASLEEASELLPALRHRVSGYGTLRMAGTFDEGLHSNAELHVNQAKLFGLPLTMVHVPIELMLTKSASAGSIKFHRWTGHIAGGHVRGDVEFRVGADSSYRSVSVLEDVELETLLRGSSGSFGHASGKISGQIVISGPDPALPKRLKGRVTLNLDDASLFELPVFKEIRRFLGELGGAFESGDLRGVIANERLVIDELTLVGRSIQLHTTGTIGFDRRVNLSVLVNTNQMLGQGGQALVGLGGRTESRGPVASFLSARLLKLRVSGTLSSPVVERDRELPVSEGAAGFFSSVFRGRADR
jgi:translocation and assembly module TamB